MAESNRSSKRKLSEGSINASESSTSSLQTPGSPSIESKTSEIFEKSATDRELVSAAEVLAQLTNTITPPPGGEEENGGSSSAKNAGTPTEVGTPSEVVHGTTKHPLINKVNKVSRHPLVTNAVKYYENSKKNYAPFNYAAEIVERAALPVVNKIEVNLNNRHQARLEAAALASNSLSPRTSKRRRVLSDVDVHSCDVEAVNKKVSLETKRRLQFCLNLLRLANDNINSKINSLQNKVAKKEKAIKLKRENHQHNQDKEDPTESIAISQDAEQETKTEIVTTVKKIIHIISNFRPSSLSAESKLDDDENRIDENQELKSTIRDIILKLPSTIQQSAANNNSAQQANDKIFVIAKESLEMISKLTNVFNDQLQKAENWVVGDNEGISPEKNNSEQISSDTEVLNEKKREELEKTSA